MTDKIFKRKTILHIDGDAFFVGVEVAKNPALKGLPVVTGGERGIVSALSYEAKALGITRGMPIFKVNKDFPSVVVLPGDYKSYVEYSGKMMDIVRRYADDVEEYSIDECFADLTGLDKPLYMTYREIAERIKKEINEELNISVTIGIAPTKVLAKVASKWVKPNGLTIIEADGVSKFLSNTKIENIWGIGPKTAEQLKKRGILTAHNFVNRNIAWVKENFSKPYEDIWLELNGIAVHEIDPAPKTAYSSVQKTRTFHPSSTDAAFLLSQLSKHIEDACAKSRHYELMPKKFSIFLKNQKFEYASHLIVLSPPTNAPEILISLAQTHFEKIYKKGMMYRATGTVLQDLIPNVLVQADLFGNSDKANKFEAIHKQIDLLEDKFGKRMVHLASTDGARKHKEKGTDADNLDRNLLFL